MKKLRFAPIVRVSTEKQDKQGESLRTQKKQILQYVEFLKGEIPDICWRYSGQEHATPEFERAKMDQLLTDSVKGLFDAVIVCDASRWSRDNLKSKAGLKILRSNNIRFFVGTTEYDLYNPEQTFFLGVSAEIGELQALQQALKSITNRINRAKRGIPASGNLPYGRTFDKKTETWDIDKEKQKEIQWVAERYLAGESFQKLSATLGVNNASLWKTVTQRSGPEWKCRFRNKRLNIDETVVIRVPPLLDEKTIAAIHRKAQANKTYTHGHIKNKYLLSRMVFCADCGNAMFGQTNHHDNRYYRHPRDRNDRCDPSFWVRCDALEESVMVHLVSMFGNKPALEKAMQAAIPNPKKVQKLSDEMARLNKRLAKIKKQKATLVDMTAKGVFTEEEAGEKIKALRQADDSIHERLAEIEPLIADSPTSQMIERQAVRIKRALHSRINRPGVLDRMTWDEKRQLVEMAFDGKTQDGRRCGVYCSRDDQGGVSFQIRGIIPGLDRSGSAPIDPGLKENIIGQRHAHHGLGFHQ